MGTHISKVKSVDLDVWTVEQMNVSYNRVLPSSVIKSIWIFSLYKNGGTNEPMLTGRHILRLAISHPISASRHITLRIYAEFSSLAK